MLQDKDRKKQRFAVMGLAAGSDTRLCVRAIPEIGVAFWHQPNKVPKKVLRLLLDRLQDEVVQVRSAALAALEELADLGCSKAEHSLGRD